MWSSMAHQNSRFTSGLVCDVYVLDISVYLCVNYFSITLSAFIFLDECKSRYVKVFVVDTHNVQASRTAHIRAARAGTRAFIYIERRARAFGVRNSSIAKGNCVPTTHRSIYRYTWTSAHITLYTFDVRHAAKANILPTSNYSPLAMYILHI